MNKNDREKGNAHCGYQSASKAVKGGAQPPRIGGKIAKGDSRTKSHSANIKPQKGY